MITSLLLQVIGLFKFALFARIIIDYVRMFKRDWRPSPFLSSIFEVIYSVTDPPMKFVQRFVPPLRVGGIALDLSFIVILIALSLLQRVILIVLKFPLQLSSFAQLDIDTEFTLNSCNSGIFRHGQCEYLI